IPSRFNGPLDSGNGGYCSRLAARHIDGPAQVTLRRPVPLDTPLPLHRDPNGSARGLQGDTLVPEAPPPPRLPLPPPPPPHLPHAAPPPATPAGRDAAPAPCRGAPDTLFPRCFVSSSIRDASFGVHAGPVDGRPLVASPWTPPAWAADSARRVLPEFMWAVL